MSILDSLSSVFRFFNRDDDDDDDDEAFRSRLRSGSMRLRSSSSSSSSPRPLTSSSSTAPAPTIRGGATIPFILPPTNATTPPMTRRSSRRQSLSPADAPWPTKRFSPSTDSLTTLLLQPPLDAAAAAAAASAAELDSFKEPEEASDAGIRRQTSRFGAGGGRLSAASGRNALGAIDPEIYKMHDNDDCIAFPEDHLGRIWFAVDYNGDEEKLVVTIIKAKNLPSRSIGAANVCDPFVRVWLLPDERRQVQTRWKRKTCNPVFNENLIFQATATSLSDRSLKIACYDVHRRRHRLVGHVTVPLAALAADGALERRRVQWRDLGTEATKDRVGSFGGNFKALQGLGRPELRLSLTFLPPPLGRLNVGIFDGRRLLQWTRHDSLYVKVVLLQSNRPLKTKRTSMSKKRTKTKPILGDENDDRHDDDDDDDVNVVFNESFTFAVDAAEVDAYSLSFHVMESHLANKDKQLGRIVLGSFMFARGKELDHWNEMIGKPKEQVSMWHRLL